MPEIEGQNNQGEDIPEGPFVPASKDEDRLIKTSLSRTILWLPVGISIALVIILGGYLLFNFRNQLHRQAVNDLSAILNTQDNTLEPQVQFQKNILVQLANDPNIQMDVDTLVNNNSDAASLRNHQSQLLAALSVALTSNNQKFFDQILVSSPDNKVLASTKVDWVGLDLNKEPRLKKLLGTTNSAVIANPSVLIQNQWITFITQPILIDGERVADLTGLSTLFTPELNNGIAGLYQSGRIFYFTKDYVMALVGNNNKIGLRLPSTSELNTRIDSMQSNPTQIGTAEYKAYDQAPVLAAWHWIPALQFGFLVELPLSLIDHPFYNLLITTILLSLLLLSLSGLIFWSAASRITQPLIDLMIAFDQFKSGNWQKRSFSKRSDEIGFLSTIFNYFASELSVLYKNLDGQVKERTRQLKTGSEVAQIVSSTNDISDLFLRTCNLVIERFNCYNASIYLVDETGNTVSLIQASGPIPDQINRKNYRLAINSQSLIGWVSSNNQARLVPDISTYPFSNSESLLPEVQSEAAIPISVGNKVLGVLHLQSDVKNAFNLDNTSVFQTLANQLGTAYQNIQHLQTAEDTIQGTSLLYESSHQIVTASTEAEIFQVVAKTLQHTPYQSALLSAEFDRLQFVSLYNPLTKEQIDTSQWDNIRAPGMMPLFQANKPFYIQELNKAPEPLAALVLPLRTIGGQSAVLIPIFCTNLFAGLLIVAARDKTFLTPPRIQTFTRLSDIMGIAIERLRKMDQIQTRLLGLKAAADIGINVSLETDLQQLYKTVHSQIIRLLGPVEFMIALYQPDTGMIEVPYIYESGKLISLDPFPLGQGLTSILIKERTPLLLVNNVEQEAIALGAKNVGAPAKSWLGVPLMIGDQVIGAMIIQDLEREMRFSEKDIELLDTFVPQLTVSIRMAQYINKLEKSAQQLETASEIARDVSSDLQVEQLLPHVVNLVKERFGFYHASIFMLDPTGAYAVLRESTGEAGAQMKLAGHQLAVGSKSIVGQTASIGAPVVINDVHQDASYWPNPLLPDTNSEVGIPMKSGNRILGVLDVQSTRIKAFSEDDVRILSILADQLAAAIINAELFDETQIHLKQQRDLHQITVAATSSPNVSEALDRVVKGLSLLLQNARVSIFLLNPFHEVLDITASVGYESTPEFDSFKIRLGEGVVGQAAKERRSINIADVKHEPHYFAVDPLVRSELAIPLIFQDKLIGVLNLESDQPDGFKEETQAMLGSMIGSLTGIIANTQLAVQNRLQMEREKQLYTLTNKIRQAFDIGTILEISATEIGQILNAKKVKLEIRNDASVEPAETGSVIKKNGGM